MSYLPADEAARRLDEAGRHFADRCRKFGDTISVHGPRLSPRKREALEEWVQVHVDRMMLGVRNIPQLQLSELDDEVKGEIDNG